MIEILNGGPLALHKNQEKTHQYKVDTSGHDTVATGGMTQLKKRNNDRELDGIELIMKIEVKQSQGGKLGRRKT